VVATFVNCLAVIAGAFIGLLFHRRINAGMKALVFTGAGIISLVLGMKMAFESTRIVYLALALICGGFIGEALDIEGAILRLGEFLKRRFTRPAAVAAGAQAGNPRASLTASGEAEAPPQEFAYGFLNASVIFCVGAMALVGSFKAGAQGDYELILTKSVLDGFVAMILAAAMGVGVAFSAASVLVYQGTLTLLARVLEPYASPLVLSELTGLGGALVVMIGINLLGLSKLKTANFLPGLLVVLVLLAIESALPPGWHM
jgi:uncharacterized membrane protein YqgA involved in biofilm formation